MAVQVPSLNRFQPTNEPSVGRVQAQVPDVVQATAPEVKAREQLVESVLNYSDKAELHAANVSAQNLSNDYEIKYKTRLEEVRKSDGDPTELYKKLDEDAKTWKQDAMKASGSGRASEIANAKIDETYQRMFESRSTSQASQYALYENKTTKAAVNLLKEDTVLASGTANITDKTSFEPIDMRLNDIVQKLLISGENKGLAKIERNAEGKITKVISTDPILQEEILKEKSEAIKMTIETLNASGKPDEAQYLMDKYATVFNSKTRLELSSGTKASQINNQALIELEKVKKYSDPKAAMAALDKIQNLEVREKTIEKLDAHQRMMENALNRSSKVLYEKLSDDVVSGKYVSWQDFTDRSEMFKGTKAADRLNAKQTKALRHQLEQPPTSDVASKSEAYAFYNAGGFKGITYDVLNEYLAGLSSTDRKKMEKLWNDENNPSMAEQNSQRVQMGSMLPGYMQTAGLISKNEYNKLDVSEQNMVNQMNDDLIKYTERIKLSPKEQTEWIKKAVADKKAAQAFAPPEMKKFQGTIKQPKKDVPPSTGSTTKIPGVTPPVDDVEKRKQINLDYYKANKGRWPTKEQVEEILKAGK